MCLFLSHAHTPHTHTYTGVLACFEVLVLYLMLTGSRRLHKHWPLLGLIIYNTCMFPSESLGRFPPTEAFLLKFTATFQGKHRNSLPRPSVYMPAERLFISPSDEVLRLICSPPARRLQPVVRSRKKQK